MGQSFPLARVRERVGVKEIAIARFHDSLLIVVTDGITP
jgi:hypothetical protein